MRPSEVIAGHRDALLEVAQRYGVTNLRIFGSVARGDDRDNSDVDLLIDAPRGTTYFDLARLKREVRDSALKDAKPL